MKMKIFITGTDTNIGKTYISVGILQAFGALKLSTLGIKPLASCCKIINNKLYNEDALALKHASTLKLPYHKINPIAFAPAIAPNIAAEQINYHLNLDTLNKKTIYAREYPADLCLMEGVGGWNVPLNNKETMADFVKTNNLPVILVVGIKLGCLNHALLTYQAIKNSQVPCIGWVANCIDPNMLFCQENITTLKTWLKIPLLATVGYQQDPAKILDTNTILSFFTDNRNISI